MADPKINTDSPLLSPKLRAQLWSQIVEHLDNGEALVTSEQIRIAVEAEYQQLTRQDLSAAMREQIFRMVEQVNRKHPETYLLRGIQNAVNQAFARIVRQNRWDDARIQTEGTPFVRQFVKKDTIRDLLEEANIKTSQIDLIQCVKYATRKADQFRNTPPGEESVLVVDDSAQMRMVICALVKQLGYKAREAVDGEDALAQARALPPNLIILDVQMPKMNGLEMLEALRREAPLKSIPVIMLTSVKNPETIRQAVTGQVEDYMVKPTQPNELKKRIRKYLG